jgi:hypothetical protein
VAGVVGIVGFRKVFITVQVDWSKLVSTVIVLTELCELTEKDRGLCTEVETLDHPIVEVGWVGAGMMGAVLFIMTLAVDVLVCPFPSCITTS